MKISELTKVFKVVCNIDGKLYSAMTNRIPEGYSIEYIPNDEQPTLPIEDTVLYVFSTFDAAKKFYYDHRSSYQKLEIWNALGVNVREDESLFPVSFDVIINFWKDKKRGMHHNYGHVPFIKGGCAVADSLFLTDRILEIV